MKHLHLYVTNKAEWLFRPRATILARDCIASGHTEAIGARVLCLAANQRVSKHRPRAVRDGWRASTVCMKLCLYLRKK